MRVILVSLAFACFLAVQAAEAGFVTIHKEMREDKRKGGVIFPIANNTNKTIDQIRGWVYGYNEKKPYGFSLVNNPHEAAIKINSGPHLPGTTSLYWFRVAPYRLERGKFGVTIYDAAISFKR